MVIFLFSLAKRINRMTDEQNAHAVRDREQVQAGREQELAQENGQTAVRSASEVLGMLEPLVRESRRTALKFDEQIKEKRRLLKGLNEALDDRIIHINLLLSRAETRQKKLEQNREPLPETTVSQGPVQQPPVNMSLAPEPVWDQQQEILKMFEQNCDIDTIARQLSVPKGEVKMVVDLKKKFLEMEKNHP